MNAEFFEALAMLEKERGLPADYLLEKIKNAIVIAVKKDYEVEDENVSVVIEPDQGKFSVSLLKTVVEEVEDPATEISLEEAQQKKKSCKAGDEYAIPLKTKDFGRIAAQTAKHVIRQGLKEAERSQMYAEMQSKAHEIISAVVTNIEPVKGIVTLELGKGGVATLPRNEQVAGEELREGQHVKVYVVDVMETERGPRMMISRTHPGLVKRMFEMEVPGSSTAPSRSRPSAARPAPARKWPSGARMKMWTPWARASAPAASAWPTSSRSWAVKRSTSSAGAKTLPSSSARRSAPPPSWAWSCWRAIPNTCRVTVPDHQLSLAIGNKGQNARLCARLTGYNIDIRPESGYYGEEPPMKKTPEPAAEE